MQRRQTHGARALVRGTPTPRQKRPAKRLATRLGKRTGYAEEREEEHESLFDVLASFPLEERVEMIERMAERMGV